MSTKFSSVSEAYAFSEANASEILENFQEMLLQHNIYSVIYVTSSDIISIMCHPFLQGSDNRLPSK